METFEIHSLCCLPQIVLTVRCHSCPSGNASILNSRRDDPSKTPTHTWISKWHKQELEDQAGFSIDIQPIVYHLWTPGTKLMHGQAPSLPLGIRPWHPVGYSQPTKAKGIPEHCARQLPPHKLNGAQNLRKPSSIHLVPHWEQQEKGRQGAGVIPYFI